MTLLTTQSGITLQSVEARPSDVGRPCVLCVHGMFGGAWQFEGWLRLLAERGYAAYAMNLRGHHDSRPVVDLGRVSVLDFVKDALAVAKGLGAPAVLGHSMGGLIAQKLAESDAVCAAVLLSSTPPRGIPVTSPMLIGRQLKYLPQMLFSRPINPDRKDADRLLFNRTPPAEADAIFERLVAESGTAAANCPWGRLPLTRDGFGVLCCRCRLMKIAWFHHVSAEHW